MISSLSCYNDEAFVMIPIVTTWFQHWLLKQDDTGTLVGEKNVVGGESVRNWFRLFPLPTPGAVMYSWLRRYITFNRSVQAVIVRILGG
jgi:hypothetical protein